jgi:excisionase family DNA binding protein
VTEKMLVSPEEAAQILSIPKRRVFELLSGGRIRSYKIGRLRRIPIEALREYIARLEKERTAC